MRTYVKSFLIVVSLVLGGTTIGCGGASNSVVEPKSDEDLELMRKLTEQGAGPEEDTAP